MTDTPLALFRADFAECEIVVLADISTGMVLAWDGSVKWPQEQLDDLCALAAQVLGVGFDADDPREAQTAMLARDTGWHSFVRAAPGMNEVLCGVFRSGAKCDGVVAGSMAVCADMLSADQRTQA